MAVTRVKSQDILDGGVASADLATGAVTAPKLSLATNSCIADNGSGGIEVQVDGTTIERTGSGLSAPAGACFKNRIINGRFDYAQRHPTGLLIGTSTPAYVCDRWLSGVGTGSGSATINRVAFTAGQTAVPGEPTFYLEHQQVIAASIPSPPDTVANSPGLAQRMENVRTFAGQQVTVSFYAKASTAVTIVAGFNQVFGASGSPTINVTMPGSGLATLGTTWQQFTFTLTLPSITGKSIGGNNYLEFQLLFPVAATYTIDIASVQIEPGSLATTFDVRPPAVEIALCQRFYCKTYDHDTVPGTSAVALGICKAMSSGTAADSITGTFTYPVQMRITPTITIYSYTGVVGKMTQNGGTEISAFADGGGTRCISVGNNAACVDQQKYFWHVTADAEL